MPIRQVTLRILGDGRSARSEMDWVNREADKLDKKKVTVDIEANTPKSKLEALNIQLDTLTSRRRKIEIDADDKPSLLAAARIDLALMKLDKFVAKPKVSDIGLERARVSAANTEVAFGKLLKSVDDFGKAAEKESNRLTKFFTPGQGFGLIGGLLGGKFALFGGLTAIGPLHLLLDVVAEILAVVIPATLALGAFGIAGSDAARDIYNHMNNLHIVMDATNKVIKPMTGNMEKLHEAVRPAVYQIFGDALTIMNDKTGVFRQLAMGTAQVMTHLAARMTVAITSGKGFGEFMKNAVPDVAKLTDSFANLFGVVGNLIHVMPGYAQILLAFGDGFLHILEVITRMGEPFLNLGLKIHGFIVWAGLGASAAFFLMKAIVALSATAIGGAVKSFATYIGSVVVLTATEGIATGATFALTAALEFLSTVNPLIWVGAALGALAGLAYWFSRSENATQRWGDALQKSVDNASSVSQGLALTQSALSITSSRLEAAQLKLATTQRFVDVVNVHTGISTRLTTSAYAEQQAIVQALGGQYHRFSGEMQFSIGRLGGLAKAYGGAKNASALMSAAGITEAEFQDKSAEGWLILTQKINGTLAGYKAMGQTSTTLGNDLQVMDIGITDQYQAMQKLNQAWDQFIGNITGSQNAFDTSAQSIQTLSAAFDTAGKNGQTIHTSIGKLKDGFTLAKAPIDSLSKSGIALNQAFTQQVTNTNALIDTWRTAGVASNLFNRGVKDSIAPLVRYARGSSEATSQLIGLAQEAGYHGPNALKNLVKWLGNTHDSLRTVRNVTDQATTQEALLTGAMNAQGKYIANTLLRRLTDAELGYGKVGKAVDAYGVSIAHFGVHSAQAKQAEDKMNASIIQTMHNAGASKDAIAEMIAKLDKIPFKKAVQIVETGLGHFSIKGPKAWSTQSLPGGFPGGVGAREGWRVPGWGGGDRWPALLEGGEAVVPKHLTPAVAPFLAANGVPGFANGVILSGNKDVLSGNSALKFDNKMTEKFTATMERSMFNAMKAMMAMGGGGEAIARFASQFGTGNNHPYVWGGMSPSGWDCSGFTSFIYKHFGYNSIPRTSESQFGWGQHSPDQPGALVFFNSPAGGPPPGHVGISLGGGRMVDAAGTGIGTIFGHTGGNMGFRIPPGGFHGGGGGGAFGGTVRENQLSSLWIAAGGPRNMGHLMAAIAMAESGGRELAHNPSGASGLWQILGQIIPGNIFNPMINAENAVAKWRTQGLGAWSTYTNGAYRRFYANGTEGAAPGWAWVGERGPELVKFKGGESVLDTHTSRLVGGVDSGYWKGTLGEALRGLRHHGFVVHKGGLPNGVDAAHPTKEPWHDMASLVRSHGWSVGDHTAGSGGGSGGSSGGGGRHSGKGPSESAIGSQLLTMLSHLNLRSNIEQDRRELLKQIDRFFHGNQRRERERMIGKQLDALENIRDRLKAQNNLINHLYADKRAIQQNLSGYGALSSLNIGPTAGTGDNVALSGGQGIKLQLDDKLKNMRKFGAALKKLHNMGLRGSLFRQVVDMGPDQGLQYAQELISGGPAFIRSLTREENELNDVEGRIAKGAASVENGRGWKTGKEFYKGLFSERERLRKLFKDLGRELGEEAGRWFKVPGKTRHRRGFAKGGILTEPVWGFGPSGTEYNFGEAGAEFFAPMSAPHSMGGHYHGGDTYNIYVTGDSDPDGAARQIITKVRDYKRRHGNKDTGIG